MTPTEHLNEIDEFYGRPAATLTLAQIQFGMVVCELRRTSGNVADAAANLGLGRACVYGLLNNFCRLTRAISSTAPKVAVSAFCFLLSALLVGCATPPPKARADARPTVPPMPVASAERNSRPTTMTATAAAIAPQPPRLATISLAWDKNQPGAITEVWSGPTIFNRTVNLRTNVVGDRVTLPCDQAAEFYRIRNRVGEAVSRWNDEGQP